MKYIKGLIDFLSHYLLRFIPCDLLIFFVLNSVSILFRRSQHGPCVKMVLMLFKGDAVTV